MKNILIIGGTRFFGSELVELLVDEGHNVTILTRGQTGKNLGTKVEHIMANRTDKNELANKVNGRVFDIVYDNICYSPNEAYEFCEVFNGKIKKLVFTSSLSTYRADGEEKRETDFDPYNYDIRWGKREDFDYGEGKRLAEAVFFKYAKFPVVAVRFPIVMGENDYTHRLHDHIDRISKGEPIGFLNLNAEMSFILATEAAQFLKWAGFKGIEGPYNATANGTITLSKLIHLIEEVKGKPANTYLVANEDDNNSPFAVPESWYMTNQKAVKQGFQFSNLNDWLKPLIETIGKSL